MVTRVSTGYNLSLITSNIQRARELHSRATEPLATGRRINRLSDDPTKITEYFRLQNELARKQQYELNINTARTQIDMTDLVVSQMVDLVNEASTLGIQANDPSLSPTEVTSISGRLTDITSEITDLANTQLDGEYIFAGYLATTQPFTVNGAPPPPMVFNGDTNVTSIQVSPTKQVPVSLNGDNLFTGGGGNTDVFLTLDDLNTAIQAQNSANIATELDNLEVVLSQFLDARATLGNSGQALDTAQSFLDNKELFDQERTALIIDADLAQATADLSFAEFTLESAFAVSSRIMQVSLSSFFD